jgi:lipid-A-disaccharide synthase
MRIAKWAHQARERSHQQGLLGHPPNSQAHQPNPRIIYYISPQVWAWKEGRVRQIRETVDKMLVILPFEKAFYKKWNYDVEYVGHPLVEVIERFRAGPPPTLDLMLSGSPVIPLQSPETSSRPPGPSKPIIALLPGSRKQEIEKKLPIMLEASRHFPDFQFVVAQAPGQEPAFYNHLTAAYPNVGSIRNQTYALLAQARAACVTSGTATLETALFGVPEIVCYKGSAVSYQIARRLIKVKYISLVNLIMDKGVVKELIQDELTPDNLRRELEDLLQNNTHQQQLRDDYRQLKELLSEGGHASANAADSILRYLTSNQ